MKLRIVAFSDVSGTGFDRQPDPAKPVERDYWSAARGLIPREVVQPPELLKPTGGVPFWGLRQTLVGKRPMWCFWVQGRGGVFGPAGTCRFGFADIEEEPALVWRAGAVQVAGQSEEQARPAKGDGTALFQVLGVLAMAVPQVAIPVGPEQAARIIGGVLGVVPRSEARGRVWATCLLQPLDGHRVAAAALPGSLATTQMGASQYIDRINRTVGPPLPEAAVLMDKLKKHLALPEYADGVALLAKHAEEGDLLTGRLDPMPADFAGLLDRIVEGGLPVDVGALLADPKRRERLARNQPAVAKWVELDPRRALEFLRGNAVQPFADWIFDRLLTLQEESTANLIGFPKADEAAGGDDPWPGRLAKLLKEQLEVHMIAALLRALLERAAIDLRDLVAARAMLLGMGLTPSSAADLFPLTSNVVAESLRDSRGLSREMCDELAAYRGTARSARLGLLSESVQKAHRNNWLHPVSAREAVNYFALAGAGEQEATDENRERAGAMALCLVGVSVPADRHPGKWLTDFLGRVAMFDNRPDGLAPAICKGTLNALREADIRRLPSEQLAEVMRRVRMIGVRDELRLQARSHLEPAPAEPVGAPSRPPAWFAGLREPGGALGGLSPVMAAFTKFKVLRWAASFGILAFVAGALAMNLLQSDRGPGGEAGAPGQQATAAPAPSSGPTSPPAGQSVAPGAHAPGQVGTFAVTTTQQDAADAVLDYVQRKRDHGIQFEVVGVDVTGNLKPGRIESYAAELLKALRDAGFPMQGQRAAHDPAALAETVTVTVTIMVTATG